MLVTVTAYLEAFVYMAAIFCCFAMPFVFIALFFFPY